MDNVVDRHTLRRFFTKAFVLRVVVLIMIMIFQNDLGTDFNQNALDPDDRRYEAGAEYYLEHADNIWDVSVLTSAYMQFGDSSGTYFQDIRLLFSKGPLWYAIVCLIIYIFKTAWAIRIFNIIISSLSVVYIYKMGTLLDSKKMGKRAANLLCFLPYPVFFSCVAYKDTFVMFCFIYLLYKTTQWRLQDYKAINHIRDVLKLIFIAIILCLLRSGFGAALCVFFLINMLNLESVMKRGKLKASLGGVVLVISCLIAVMAVNYYDTIIYKFSHYTSGREESLVSSTISLLMINGIQDIYKLPFSYMFSILMPINVFAGIKSWYDIVTNLNIIMIPIAIGCVLFMIRKQKKHKFLYWGCMAFYMLSIITSLNIFRHYYSLMPITLLAFSEFSLYKTRNETYIVLLGSLALFSLLIVFYAL